jgi:hypothetical protein
VNRTAKLQKAAENSQNQPQSVQEINSWMKEFESDIYNNSAFTVRLPTLSLLEQQPLNSMAGYF